MADYFDWTVRTDRDGKASGIYSTTPYPITESSTEYSPKNDENPTGKTFTLGTKYYVDGAAADDLGNGSWATPFKTIGHALTDVTSGNKTIIVRGAHDSFDGIYYDACDFYGRAGSDDTHRYMLVGYGQERPILDGQNGGSRVTRSQDTDAYITVQRLKLQNTKNSGIRLGMDYDKPPSYDGYFSAIDVWMYQCGYDWDTPTDGSCYYLNCGDGGWISHCLEERSYGHGFKIGDGTSHHILEWSVARNNGYWPGISTTAKHSAVAIDYPVDNDTRNAHDNICRYNIAYDAVNYALQVRRVANFSVHHNEFYNCIHHDEIPPTGGTLGKEMIILYAGQVDGEFYSNIVRDPSSTATDLMYVDGEGTGSSPEIFIYNNLIYGATETAIWIGSANVTPVYCYNNTIYQDTSGGWNTVYSRNPAGNIFKNNIIYQAGTDSCLEWSTEPTHTYNRFYFPSGSRPNALGANETDGDPLFVQVPSGNYDSNDGKLQAGSACKDAGVDLSSIFTDSFNNVIRSAWDIGAYEYFSTAISYVRIG